MHNLELESHPRWVLQLQPLYDRLEECCHGTKHESANLEDPAIEVPFPRAYVILQIDPEIQFPTIKSEF